MVKETRKRWARKESLVRMLRPFLVAPLKGTLGASWHWQVGINPWQAPLWGLPSFTMRHHRTAELGSNLASHLLCAPLAFDHSLTQAHHRVSKAENVFTRRTKQTELQVSLPRLEDPGWAPKMIAYGERFCQVSGLWRVNSGTKDRSRSLRALRAKLYLRWQNRESFWHRH